VLGLIALILPRFRGWGLGLFLGFLLAAGAFLLLMAICGGKGF